MLREGPGILTPFLMWKACLALVSVARCAAPCAAPPDLTEIVQSTGLSQCSFEGFSRWRLDHRCQADR